MSQYEATDTQRPQKLWYTAPNLPQDWSYDQEETWQKVVLSKIWNKYPTRRDQQKNGINTCPNIQDRKHRGTIEVTCDLQEDSERSDPHDWSKVLYYNQ